MQYSFYNSAYRAEFLGGKKINTKSVPNAIKNGIAYLSEDRKTYGLVLGQTISKNISLANLKRISKRGILNIYKEIKETGENMTRDNLFGESPLVPETSLETSVTDRNPPTFLWATYTDGSVPVENTLMYANALREKDVPFDLHIFNTGPHAMGLATPDSAWQEDHTDVRAAQWHALCVDWLKGLK